METKDIRVFLRPIFSFFCFSKTTLVFAFLHVLLNFISPLNRILVSFSSKDVSFCYVIGNVFSNSTKRVIFIFLRMKFYLLHINMIINLIFLTFNIRMMRNLINRYTKYDTKTLNIKFLLIIIYTMDYDPLLKLYNISVYESKSIGTGTMS